MVDSETKIIEGVEEALRNMLNEKAELEISRLVSCFSDRLYREKEEAIGKIMRSIRVTGERGGSSADFDIRIRFRGGEHNGQT